ncbi:hypothetical protein GCM10010520_15990 [Rhizobium viscosum]|uniref:DUF982 domain-containing protein n=1 Tax=Rhizobium viscosum TaxID=1673 RepID=A0ABR9IXD3_RHIVS|nr:DUF982 domain-containing protein [Rhizobium viscosum]MBE1507860.1 hypothetical protein [Rhizobium viscosum]
MDNLQSSTPIRPLHVEIDGVGKYRQARSVEDLAAFLLSEQWPHLENDPAPFHHALMTSIDAMQLYLDSEVARQAFVEAAHASRMHVLPDDMQEEKKAGRRRQKPRRSGAMRGHHTGGAHTR